MLILFPYLLPLVFYITALAATLYWLDSVAPRRAGLRVLSMPWQGLSDNVIRVIVVIIALLLAFRLLPGTAPVELAPDLVVNTGKLLAGVWVAAYLLGRSVLAGPEPPLPAFPGWGRFGLVATSVIIAIAAVWMLDAGVHWDAFMPARLLINLSVTCVAEELFFRALLLRWQLRYWPCSIAVLSNALLFGLVHMGAGLEFMVLAAVAGGLYSLVYLRSGKISAAVGVHFLVNIPLLLLG